MTDRYSLYDAKAQLSALIRRVREGHSITITVHGEPVAELRPYQPPAPQTLAERIAELERRGEITPAVRADPSFWHSLIGAPVPGALERFLADRD